MTNSNTEKQQDPQPPKQPIPESTEDATYVVDWAGEGRKYV